MNALSHSSRVPAKTALIGAGGRMGAMLCARAAAAGLTVAGADQPLTPECLDAACLNAELALLCVPAAVFGEVARRVSPHLPPTAVLADITSVKEQPLRQMEKAWPGPVVGAHPLFGPNPGQEADLPVAVTPGHNATEEHLRLTEGFFTALGCRTFRTTAEKHDQAMARIQNMNFITNLAYFALLAGQEDLLPFLTPSFRRRQNAARKMLTEDARLFAGLFEANPHSHEAVRQYRQMLNLAAAGDIDLLCRRAQWWWGDDTGGES
ncbi:prephenate dehydrogenase/arogenate dehydrogenase family protein [Desulfovibrio sp. SGI.169]|uniref:prephenate dehydrogenase/arogenate dehydrogenase family protein n=1 Tax=Desulfovibrio sp. SGI.169 TaxID=3420561 RepID=UPI003D03FFD5